jgi:hypothetical protein
VNQNPAADTADTDVIPPGLPGAPGAADADTDMGAILGTAEVFKLESGMAVRLRPLASLEIFALLGIITAGLGPAMAQMRLDPDEEERTFIARMVGMTISALPNAGKEAVAFLRMMVEPADLVRAAPGARLHPQDKARNDKLRGELDELMVNPDPMDMISIIEAIWYTNAGDLQALGKRLAAMVRLSQGSNGRPPATGPTPVPRTSRA